MNPPMKLASNHVVVVVMILGLFLSVATHSFEVAVSSTSEPVQVNKVLLPSSPTSVLTHDTLQTKASYASACDCPTCTPIVMEPKTYVYLNVSCPSNTFARYKRMSVGSTNPNDYFTTTTIETSEQYAFETGNPYMYYIYLSKKNSSCFAVEDVVLPVTKTLTYVQCNNLLNANCSLLFNYNYVCMKDLNRVEISSSVDVQSSVPTLNLTISLYDSSNVLWDYSSSMIVVYGPNNFKYSTLFYNTVGGSFSLTPIKLDSYGSYVVNADATNFKKGSVYANSLQFTIKQEERNVNSAPTVSSIVVVVVWMVLIHVCMMVLVL